MKALLKPNFRCGFSNDLGETTGYWDVTVTDESGKEIGVIEVKEERDYKSYWLGTTKAEICVNENIKELLIEKAEEAVEKQKTIKVEIN